MKLEQAICKITELIKEDGEMEDGDEVVSVFGNATIIISLENHELKVKVLLGEPYTFEEEIEF